MPDELREGEGLDPNTDVGFNTMLAKQAGRELSSEEAERLSDSERNVSAGLTFEESTQPRDESGRFAAREPEAAPAAPAEGAAPAEAEAQQEEEVDPITGLALSLLDKHEGNAEAAVAEALSNADEHAQSLIGKQSNEVGDLRRQNQDLAERLARIEGYREAAAQAPQPAAPPPGLPDPTVLDGIGNMAAERGWQPTMNWIAQNRPDLFEPALEMWGEDQPFQAAQVAVAYRQNLSAPTGPPAPSENDAVMEEIRLERAVGSALEIARSSLPVPQWDAIKSHFTSAFDKAPEAIQQMVISSDHATQKAGVEVVVELAKGRVIAEATAKARRESVEAAVPTKQAAMVATGSLRPAAERKPDGGGNEPPSKEEATAAFHKRILDANTTSVQDGLTFGQPYPTR
jgi:hypothetical protein